MSTCLKVVSMFWVMNAHKTPKNHWKPVKTFRSLVVLPPLWCFQMSSNASQVGTNSRVSATDTLASVWAGRLQSSTAVCWELIWCPSWPPKSKITSTVGSGPHFYLVKVDGIQLLTLDDLMLCLFCHQQATTKNTSGPVWMIRPLRMTSAGLMATLWWGIWEIRGCIDPFGTNTNDRNCCNNLII